MYMHVRMIVDVFGNWKLLEIGLLLITGGTEYLCRILNVSFFGSAVVPASPAVKRSKRRASRKCTGFGALAVEVIDVRRALSLLP